MMRFTLNMMLAASLTVLALAACKDDRVTATPSGAGNSEAGASGGSAASPGGERGNTGMSSDSPAATAPGTTNGTGATAGGTSGTGATAGANPNASDRPVTPPPDGKTNTTR